MEIIYDPFLNSLKSFYTYVCIYNIYSVNVSSRMYILYGSIEEKKRKNSLERNACARVRTASIQTIYNINVKTTDDEWRKSMEKKLYKSYVA